MEVTLDITKAKTSVESDANHHGPELHIKGDCGSVVVLCFENEETMRLFGVAVGALCSNAGEFGLVNLRKVNKITEPAP